MDGGKSLRKKIAKRKSEEKLNASSHHKRSARQMTAEPLVDTVGSLFDIRVLNDDCLIHIFSFLTKKERIVIERVCKRWQECSMQMWRCTKHLDFRWLGSDSESKLTTDLLHHLTDRCGPNLQSIDISFMMYGLEETALQLVAGKCPNLRCLNASSFNLHNKLNCLYGIANQLQRIIFEDCKLTDEELNDFFPLCPALTSVSLEENDKLTTSSLSKLNSNIEELAIDSDGIYRSSIAENISRFKCLKRLSMNGMNLEILQSVRLNDIFKNLTQLETLCLNQHYRRLLAEDYDYGYQFKSFSHLTGLVSLSLFGNEAVNEEALRAISENCKKIESLDISAYSVDSDRCMEGVTDAGIAYVARMPKLVDFKMCNMDQPTDRALLSLAEEGRLKKLEIRECRSLTDFGCSRLVAMCESLERFDIRRNYYLTYETVCAVNASVKLRIFAHP